MHATTGPLRKAVLAMFIVFGLVTTGLSQIPIRGPDASPELKKELDQFNADVAAWNKRCKITRTEAEEAWCKKERARIDARRKELVASGAIPR
jgi:hypothetical protein